MELQMKAIRTRLGLSQKDAATLLKIPVRRYGSYEREERGLTLEDACAVADAFHVTLDELAGRWEYVSQIPSATADELEIIDAYRSTDERGQRSIQRAAQGAVEDFERGSSVETVKDPAGIDRTA